MQLDPLLALLALRYRLLWAHARSRNGRIVLLLSGYFLAATLAVLLALGGVSAAIAAIRLGRGVSVARALLTGLCVNSTLAALFLGLGVNPAFSDRALRRYPLSSAHRLVASHLTGFLEPLWMLVLALTLGLAAGFWSLGSASPWVALPAAVLFVGTNYLLARVLMRLGDLIVSMPGGSLLLILILGGGLVTLSLAPALLARVASSGVAFPSSALLDLTPPMAAAAAIASRDAAPAVTGLIVLALWLALLGALLIAGERLPLHSSTIADARAIWRHPCDTIAALFGPRLAPLAGKILRYDVRGPARYNYIAVLPAVALFISHSESPADAFLFALGSAPAVGFGSTLPLSMNLFGFDGHGLRRYFLLPVPSADVFRTVALVGLFPGALIIPIGLVTWLMFTPIPTDGRMWVMLISASLGGLLFLHALGLWTTLLSPCAMPFSVTFGNKLSFAANLLMIVTMAILFGLPFALMRVGFATVVGAWWVPLPFFVGAAALYAATVRIGASVFLARRERILAQIEGRV